MQQFRTNILGIIAGVFGLISANISWLTTSNPIANILINSMLYVLDDARYILLWGSILILIFLNELPEKNLIILGIIGIGLNIIAIIYPLVIIDDIFSNATFALGYYFAIFSIILSIISLIISFNLSNSIKYTYTDKNNESLPTVRESGYHQSNTDLFNFANNLITDLEPLKNQFIDKSIRKQLKKFIKQTQDKDKRIKQIYFNFFQNNDKEYRANEVIKIVKKVISILTNHTYYSKDEIERMTNTNKFELIIEGKNLISELIQSENAIDANDSKIKKFIQRAQNFDNRIKISYLEYLDCKNEDNEKELLKQLLENTIVILKKITQ